MPKQSAIRKTAIWFYFALFALLLTPSPIQAYAQEGDGSKPGEERSSALAAENVRFEHLTTEHGLSNNRVVSILKDSQGFMWFGTFDGLNRFDGNQFKVFKHIIGDESSLSANVILALHEDRDGSIWIGTSGGGLNRFDPETEQFTRYRHDPDDPLSLGSDTVFVIYQDRQGNLWIGTGGGGLNRYDPQADFFVRYQHDPEGPHSLSDDTVRSVFEDSQGVLWVGTEGGGLNRFDRQRERFTTYRHDPDDPHSLGNDSVAVIYEDSAGALWVGLLGGGLDRLDRETERFIHHRHDPENPFSLSHNVVASLYEDPAGKLWVSTGGGGLNLLDPQTGQFTRFQPNPDDPYSLSHSNSQFIYGDQTGLLWIGSTGGGVDKLDLGRKPFAHYRSIPGNPDSLSSNDVLGIYEDDEGVLWIGTSSGGLNRLDRHTKQVTRYMHDPEDPHSLSHNLVREIVQDQAGMLWLATRGGVNRFDQQTDQFVIYLHDPADPSSLLNDNVMTIRVDQAGVLWIGTWTGLNSLDPRTGESISYQHILSDPNSSGGITVISIYEDQAGVLWLGTFGDGLVRFDPQTERVTHYLNDEDDLHSLNDNTVFAINEDRAGTLWVGTSSGLDRFDRDTGGFIHYGEKDGLPAAGVLGILEDDLSTNQGGPNLWLSTSLGLSRFNPQTGSVRNYDASDGLQGDEFSWGSAFKSKAGELFFGGTNGLTAFYPSQIIDNPHIPPVVITDFQLANKPVELGEDSVLKQPITETDQLTLTYEDRVISFEFAALNYRAPEKNRYRYMLEGFDEEWTEVGSDRRFVTYTNLDPGAYVFSVIGSNNDGVWNEEGASLAITITPPWWQTWWFRGTLLLLASGLVLGVFIWQRRRRRTREQELEALVAARTLELKFAQAQIGTIFENSPLAIGTASLEGEILTANSAMSRIFGYPQDELIGVNVIDFFPDTEQRANLMKRLMAKKIIQIPMVQLRRKDGSLFYANLTESILARDDHDVLLGVVDDITTQVLAEQALRESEALETKASAVAAERDRLARELHDLVTQSLYTSSLIAEALPKVWQTHPEEALISLDELRQLNLGALAEMRTLLLELRPDTLIDRPLGELLIQLAEAMSSRTNLPITTSMVGNCQLPLQAQVALYRIAQEALNNISKHARATRAWVNLRCSSELVTLRITDNGRGFDPGATEPHRLGLSIMRERVEDIGASLNIKSQPGQGTEILVEWQETGSEY